LLVPGWLASFRGRVDGKPVAIAPHRDLVLVGGDARPDLVARLLAMAEREFEGSNRRLSPCVYTTDANGALVPYAAAEGTPLAVKLRLAERTLALYEYDAHTTAILAQAPPLPTLPLLPLCVGPGCVVQGPSGFWPPGVSPHRAI